MNRAEAARLKLLAAFPRGTWHELLDSAGGLDAEMSSIRARMEAALAEHEARMAPMRAYIAQLQEYEQLAGPVEAAGWLPHETTPCNLVRAHNDADTLNRAMEAYYSANWADVAAHFLRRLDAQCVDDEAKDLFRECLTAHGAKLYRIAARALFPEIERVVRIEIGWGAEQTSTSQIELRDVIGGLTPIEMQTPGWYGLHLAGKLDEGYSLLPALSAVGRDLVAEMIACHALADPEVKFPGTTPGTRESRFSTFRPLSGMA